MPLNVPNDSTTALLCVTLVALLFTTGCTDLTETMYPEVTEDNFYRERSDVKAAFFRPYDHTGSSVQNLGAVFRLQELTADQLAWPQKGRHGYDGGNWVRQHRHTWTSEESDIWDAWRELYTGIGHVNHVLDNVGALDLTRPQFGYSPADTTAMMAEMRVLRAWYYMKLLDLFGNVPIVEHVGDAGNPPTRPREDVFAYVEQLLTENVDMLLTNEDPGSYGRITQAAAYTMLAKLYVNAEVWSGTPRWADAVDVCNVILSGSAGSYQLDAHWQDPFASNNDEVSQENIWALSQDTWGQAYYYVVYTLHYSHSGRFGFGGINGIVAQEAAFRAFQENDLRKNMFLIGPQTSTSGDPLYATEEYAGAPLVLVPYIARMTEGGRSDMLSGEENSGARPIKYRIRNPNDPLVMANDLVVYRLADVYLLKAEALMRLNGGQATAETVDQVNTVRERAFAPEDWPAEAYTVATLTMDSLLAERGREFFMEGMRRQDLIRFGRYADASWWDKEPSEPYRRLFPIPRQAVANNAELEQNPGYD